MDFTSHHTTALAHPQKHRMTRSRFCHAKTRALIRVARRINHPTMQSPIRKTLPIPFSDGIEIQIPSGPHTYFNKTWVGRVTDGIGPGQAFASLSRHATPLQGVTSVDGGTVNIPIVGQYGSSLILIVSRSLTQRSRVMHFILETCIDRLFRREMIYTS